MSGLERLLLEGEKKTLIVPEKYRYMRIAAAIARDQLGLDEDLTLSESERWRRLKKRTDGRYIVSWDSLIFWTDAFANLEIILRPEIVFSAYIPPDVVVISEQPAFDHIVPWKGSWDTIADKLPRHETKSGPVGNGFTGTIV